MPPIPELEEIRKKQILEAGLKTLTRKGIATVTLDDVCKEAGLSKGGMVHYYKSKQILFMAVFEEFFRRIFQQSVDTMESYDTPMDKLLSFGWLYDWENEDTAWGYPLILNLMFLSAHDEEYRDMLRGWIGKWVTLLGEALELGIKQEIFLPMDVIQTAQSLSAVFQGVGTRWFLARETHSSDWAVTTFNNAIKGILSPYMKSTKG